MTPLQKLPKNVGDMGKLIVAKGFKGCPKCKKSPNLDTLVAASLPFTSVCRSDKISRSSHDARRIQKLGEN